MEVAAEAPQPQGTASPACLKHEQGDEDRDCEAHSGPCDRSQGSPEGCGEAGCQACDEGSSHEASDRQGIRCEQRRGGDLEGGGQASSGGGEAHSREGACIEAVRGEVGSCEACPGQGA